MTLLCLRAMFHTSICRHFVVGKLVILLELLLVLNFRKWPCNIALQGALQKDPSLFSKSCAECAVAVLFCAPYVFLIIIVYDDDVLIVNIVP